MNNTTPVNISDELYALDAIGKNNEMSKRLKEQAEKLMLDKENIVDAANSFSKKYKTEIALGTKKMQKLLEEGKNKGLTDEQVISQAGFMPTVRTPILNMLYFLAREHPDADKIDYNRMFTDVGRDTQEAINENNKKYGGEYYDDKESYGSENSPTMDSFIYGNMTNDMFNKIKKLKALSRSPQKAEAFAAYSKCMELCKEYGLEFDKIPCNV
jgi:hypothetical protein